MKKEIILFLTITTLSGTLFAQQTQQKKVCNVLGNGAEFCTVFNVPIDNPKQKTEEEINKELEKESELVFADKNKNKDNIQPFHNSNKNVKKIDSNDSLQKAEVHSREVAQVKVGNVVAQDVTIEQKPTHKSKEKSKGKEKVISGVNSTNAEVETENKPVKVTKENIVPKEKDRKSFSDYVKALKSLE